MNFNIDYNLAGAVIFTGIVVVFLALIALTLIVKIVGKLMTAVTNKTDSKKNPNSQPKAVAPVAVPQQPIQPQTASTDGIDDEIIAVISAAIAAMSNGGTNYVLKSVRRAREARPAWSYAGMTQNTQPF